MNNENGQNSQIPFETPAEPPTSVQLKCPTDGADLTFAMPDLLVFDHPIASVILVTHPKGVDCPRCGGWFALRVGVNGGAIVMYPAQAQKPAEEGKILRLPPNMKFNPRGN